MAKTNTSINGKDYFRIQRVVGINDGRSVKKSFYGRNKKEAEKKYQEYVYAQKRKKYQEAMRADYSLFCERAEEFIDNSLKISVRYAQGTIDRYVSAYTTHIHGTPLDGMVAKEIKAADIQRFYNSLKVSDQTIRQVHKFMVAFYRWMVLNEYAPDVLSAVEIPSKPSTKRHDDIVTWSESEVEQIINTIGNHRLRFLVFVLLYTGARTGEAIALKYSDFTKDVVRIQRQNYDGEIKEPKAHSSRDIPMHPTLKDELKRHIKWHKKEMRDNGYETDFVFTTDSGNFVDARNIRRSLKRFYERNGLPPKHNHVYRSTFCTQLCKCGTPLEVASKLLGHKNIEVTAKHYTHVQQDIKVEAIMRLVYE